LSEPEQSEPEPELHRVTAPAPTKRCGSLRLRLRLRNTGFSLRPLINPFGYIWVFGLKMPVRKPIFFYEQPFNLSFLSNKNKYIYFLQN
jgi:hypothetical protein